VWIISFTLDWRLFSLFRRVVYLVSVFVAV